MRIELAILTLLATLGARLKTVRNVWDRHLEQGSPEAAPVRRDSTYGVLIALVATLLIAIFAGAAFSLSQIRLLKAEINALQHELLPLKDRLSRIDQAEAARAAQAREAGSARADVEKRPSQLPLALSREDIQLIREYIKPAPFAGPPALQVAVGDPVSGDTIPLPSPVTDRIPKLLGARFAIRNGTVVIVRKDSRVVDAVVPAN